MLPIKPISVCGISAVLACLFAFGVGAQTLKDPTRPAVVFNPNGKGAVVNSGSRKLVLNSITWTGKQAFAVINNKIYHRGDSVQGVKISQIHREQVVLDDGRKLVLFTSVTGK